MIPSLPGLLHSGTPQQAAGWTLDNVQYVGFNDFLIQVEDFVLSTDGNHFYFINSDTDSIYQWDLSTPFDIQTAVNSGKALVTTPDGLTNPKGLSFKPDMSKLYVHQFNNISAVIYEYDVPDFTDISLSTITSNTLAQANPTWESRFNSDGTKIRTIDRFNNFEIYSQDASVPYSLTSVGPIVDTNAGIFTSWNISISWKDDKTRLMTGGESGQILIELFSMTNDDINTLQKIQSYDVTTASLGFLVQGAHVSSDGKNVYTRDPGAPFGYIRQYSL